MNKSFLYGLLILSTLTISGAAGAQSAACDRPGVFGADQGACQSLKVAAVPQVQHDDLNNPFNAAGEPLVLLKPISLLMGPPLQGPERHDQKTEMRFLR